MGLGRHGGGLGAVRYLCRLGARVRITDLADEAQLSESLRAIADLPVAGMTLGAHRECEFQRAEIMVVNPAVRPEHAMVRLAREAGARVTSELELFLEACPCRRIGVTGSNGKSTCAAMTSAMLQASGQRSWLGGNIGGSLLNDLERMRPDDVAVVEVSSFQLHWMERPGRWFDVALITNCTPNHLDWHGTLSHYVGCKRKILLDQAPTSVAVLNDLDPEVSSWAPLVRGRLAWPAHEADLHHLSLLGAHHRINAACAASAALNADCDVTAIARALGEFRGLPHRLEFVAEIGGRRFVNDSKATTPESARAALDALAPRVWLLAGGHAKGLSLADLARRVAEVARGAAFFGAAGEELRALTAHFNAALPVARVETLRDALDWCWARSAAGDTVLLSPGCASFDQFVDYRQRGETFVELVRGLSRG